MERCVPEIKWLRRDMERSAPEIYDEVPVTQERQRVQRCAVLNVVAWFPVSCDETEQMSVCGARTPKRYSDSA